MAAKGPSMDLSSFTDILTCILGILILIILLTGIDASQISVLIATPKELVGDDKSPIFFECRGNSLFHISPDALRSLVQEKTEELRARVDNDENEFLKQAAQMELLVDGQRMDFTYAMMGRYMLLPDPGAEGYRFPTRYMDETSEMWFGSRLAEIDPETQFICFFVRPDSYKVFQQARALAWVRGISVSVELQDERNPIVFGPGGQQVLPQ
jgi:hypothetical protein